MDHTFNAEEFLEKLALGAFDGRLQEEFRKLSHEQREQVALLMAKRLKQEVSTKHNPGLFNQGFTS